MSKKLIILSLLAILSLSSLNASKYPLSFLFSKSGLLAAAVCTAAYFINKKYHSQKVAPESQEFVPTLKYAIYTHPTTRRSIAFVESQEKRGVFYHNHYILDEQNEIAPLRFDKWGDEKAEENILVPLQECASLETVQRVLIQLYYTN
jgi:hypothetical protein